MFHAPESRGRHLLPIALRCSCSDLRRTLTWDAARVPGMNKPRGSQFPMVTDFKGQVGHAY